MLHRWPCTPTHCGVCQSRRCEPHQPKRELSSRARLPAVVVVDGHGRVVIGKYEISVNGIPKFAHSRAAIRQVEHVDLAVPAVEAGVVAALSVIKVE